VLPDKRAQGLLDFRFFQEGVALGPVTANPELQPPAEGASAAASVVACATIAPRKIVEPESALRDSSWNSPAFALPAASTMNKTTVVVIRLAGISPCSLTHDDERANTASGTFPRHFHAAGNPLMVAEYR